MLSHRIVAPCAYQGGKQRVASDIVDVILHNATITDTTTFIDVCCGSGAISVELMNRGVSPHNILMCDVSIWGAFWKAVGDGSFSTEIFDSYCSHVPEDKNLIASYMKRLCTTIDDYVYKYPLLQASAFGGKQIYIQNGAWQNTSFRRYWTPTAVSSRKSPVNPIQPSVSELRRRVHMLVDECKGIKGYNCDAVDMIPIVRDTSDCIVYIDPPYQDTTGYAYDFDYMKFIDEIMKISSCPIFVSEAKPISMMAVRLQFNGGKGGISGKRKEKHEEWLSAYNVVLNHSYVGDVRQSKSKRLF